MKFQTVAFRVVTAGVVAAQVLMPLTAYAASNTNSPKIQSANTTLAMAGHTPLHFEHIVAKDPWSGKATSWVSVSDLQKVLQLTGVQSTWNNATTLNITSTPAGWKLNTNSASSVGNLPMGEMQFSIGGAQHEFIRSPKLVARDPVSGVDITYVPVYYADLFLQHQLRMKATWEGNTWSLFPQATFSPITSIQSLMIDSGGAVSIEYVPKTSETTSVTQQVLSWLKSATTTTMNLSPSTPGLRFEGYVGPSRLFITAADKSQIKIYPAYTITAVGKQGKYQVNYEPNVVAYVAGNETTYLNAPKLYTWLKNNQWQAEFTTN